MYVCMYVCMTKPSSVLLSLNELHIKALRSTVSAMPTAPITYNGFLHCIGSIYCSEGVRGFYRVIMHVSDVCRAYMYVCKL